MKTTIALLLFTLAAAGQDRGVPTEWDIRQTLESISSHSTRLQPLLEQIHPADWSGAPATYTQQWTSIRAQAEAVRGSTAALARRPEKLTAALDTFFRLQTLETLLASLTEGVRKYQNPALADLLADVMSENSAARQQLRQYLVDLADLKEKEHQIMDQEAQRCRAMLSRQPLNTGKKRAEAK